MGGSGNEERPIVEATLVERFTNERTVAEVSVVENAVTKKVEVDSLLVKFLEAEDI